MTAHSLHGIGFLIALPDEARSLHPAKLTFDALTQLPGGHWLTVSGAGPAHAARAATRLLEQGVAGLVSWGCAAALNPGLRPGDLLLPKRILAADGEVLAIPPDWRDRFARATADRIGVCSGILVESNGLVADVAAKQSIHAITGADGLDMESSALARVARDAGLPFLAVRAVADHARMGLPDCVTAALDGRGAVHLPTLLGHALRRPTQFVHLIRLGWAFGAAMRTLRLAAQLAGPDFLLTPPAADH